MSNYQIEDNPHKGNKGITRAFRAAINSWNGLIYAYKEESAFRQELALSLILIPLAIYLPVTPIEKILLIASVILVLVIELLNSSVEAAIDRISFEVHDLKAQVKAINPGNIIEPYDHDDFRAKYSDHLPVSFKLITGRDSD